MTYYYLESSALAKLFVQEDGSAALIELLSGVADERRIASPLAFLEVRSAVRRRESVGEIRSDDAASLLTALSVERGRIVEQPLSIAVMETAAEIIDRHLLRTLDALHLATCLIAQQHLTALQMCFVSSDRALARAAAAEGLETLDPVIL